MKRRTQGCVQADYNWAYAFVVVLVAAMINLGQAWADDDAKPKSIWDQDTLTGDWGGARSALGREGIDLTLNYVDEIFGNVSGGLYRRSSYEGRAEFSVDTDLQKLVGWDGSTAHATIYEIHNIGHVDAEDNVGAISDPSNIDAWPTTRLFTAWFQQKLFNGHGSLRIGQLGADDEFMISPTASNLINATFGWPDIFSANMPSGGPVYPLATPGVRLKLDPIENLSLLSAIFSGDPAGSDCADTNREKCDKYGTKFSFSGGALWMNELQYAVNDGRHAVGLPGIYKLGFWYHTANFADEHVGMTPGGAILTLANPSTAEPLLHHGNWGIYGLADQMIWQYGVRSLNLFLRGGISPPDRNLLSYYVDTGVGLKGILPGRSEDVLTLGAAYAKISSAVVALDQDALAISGPPYAVRDHEVVIELNYMAKIAPWWTLQPDLQYFIHPNGGQNPNDPMLRLDHAFVAGIRSTVKF